MPLKTKERSDILCFHCQGVNLSEAVFYCNCGFPLMSNGKETFSVNGICDVFVDEQLVEGNVKAFFALHKGDGTYIVVFQNKYVLVGR